MTSRSGRQLNQLGIRAFTLLELLVALTVSGVVALAIAAAVGLAVDVAGRGSDPAQESLRAEAVLSAVRSWLEGARLSEDGTGPAFEGKDGGAWGSSRDELVFATMQTEPLALSPDHGQATIMRLRVAEGDSGLVLEYRATISAQLRSDEPVVLVLLPQVRGLDLRYLIRLGGEARWFDAWSSRVRLPEAVEIRLLSESREGRLSEWPPLLVALPVRG